MLDNQNIYKKINLHYIFLGILSLNYLIPLLIFNDITLFYHDALDSEIVYNGVLGKIYFEGLDKIKIFLNEQIKVEYLRRVFQPLTLLYGIFNVELAYWLTDVIVKLTSYFSFYLLSKKFYKKSYICYLSACLYASINLPTHSGLGTAIFPYLVYLLIFKDNIKIKNYIIIFFFGLNSDFLTTIISIPFLILLIFSIKSNQKKIDIFKYVKIFFIFCISIVISNFNLILLPFSDEVMHRTEYVKEILPLTSIIKNFFFDLFKIPNALNWTIFSNLPLMLMVPSIFFLHFFVKKKEVAYVFYIIIFLQFLVVATEINFFADFFNNTPGLLKSLGPRWAKTIFPLLFSFLSFLILINGKPFIKKILSIVVLFSILISQINSSIVPFYKEKILKEINYRNIYSFKGYYLYEDYRKIKKIVKNKKTISIGVDPMSAIINDIYTIDGYHNLYPLSYKKKFYNIIEDELNADLKTKNYFNNWGSRVYAFVGDPQKIQINFKHAKKIGASYVISKYDLNSDQLTLICGDCSKYFKLYLIN